MPVPMPANHAFPDSPHFPPEVALMLRYAVLLAALLMLAAGCGNSICSAADASEEEINRDHAAPLFLNLSFNS